MKKSILEVYALAVCFATIVCFAVALGVAIYDGVRITHPDFTMNSSKYDEHQSNDAFFKNNKFRYSDKERNYNRPPDDQLTKERIESYQTAFKSERRDGFQSLTICLIIIIIDIVIFLIHWRLARRSRESNIIT